MKGLFDPQSISRATWSLIANNVLTSTAVLALTVIEGAISIFYALVMQQIMLQLLKTDTMDSHQFSDSQITLSFEFLMSYQDVMKSLGSSYIVLSLTFLGIYVFLGLCITILTLTQRHKIMRELSEKEMFQQALGCVLIIFSKVLYIPMLDIMIRAFIQFTSLDIGLYIGFCVLNVISLILYLTLVFYSRRIMRLNMISDLCTWSQANDTSIYLGFLAKTLVPVIIGLDQDGKYIYVEIIITMFVMILILSMSIMFADYFDQKNDIVQKIIQGIVVLILEIGVIKYLFKEYDQKEGIYLLILVLFQGYFIYKINQQRKEKLLTQFHEGKLKLEIDFLFVLLYLLEICHKSLIEQENNQEYYSEILKMLEIHELKCIDEDCICRQSDAFLELFRVGQRESSNVFLVEIQQFKEIKKYLTDSTHSLFVSSISRMKGEIGNSKQRQGREEEESQQMLQQESMFQDHPNITVDQLQNQSVVVSKKKRTTVKVEIQQIKKKFISNFLLIYFKEIQNKIVKFINEFYILYQFDKTEKQSQNGNNDANVDGEHFIKINDLYDKFHSRVEALSNETCEFWRGYTQEEINVYKQHELGTKIADNITKSYQIFREIEETLIFKDYKIYIMFAHIQLKIMNDQDGYNIFIQKTKGVLQMNKLFQNNLKNSKTFFNEDSGFVIVDGHSQSYGRILFMNKTMRKWLLRNEEELKFISINSFMPKLIDEKHDEFMKKYNQTGESVMLNKKLLNFLTDKNGSLFPAEIMIKFHYSQKYQYSFIALANLVKDMTPFSDGLKYQTEQLIFMTLDLENGQLLEVSSNFLQVLQLSGDFQYRDIREVSFTERVRTINEIIPDFNMDDLYFSRQKSDVQDQVVEGIYRIDVSSFNENIDLGYATKIKNVDLEAKVAVYIESYESGKFQMGYVVMNLIKQEIVNDNMDQSFDYEVIENRVEDQVAQDKSYGSSSVGSSQSGSSMSSYNQIQQFHSFYQQQTPRILKIVIQLILLMFLVSSTIGTVNLVLNIKNSSQSVFEVLTVRKSIDRINLIATTRLELRILMNIANGYESNASPILSNRSQTYKDLINQGTDQLRQAQTYLDNSGFQFSENFLNIRSASDVQIVYLQKNNRERYENTTFKNAIGLYIGKLILVTSYSMDQYRSDIDIASLTQNFSLSYVPSDYSQTLFFVVMNGNGVLKYYNRYFTTLYLIDTQTHADDNLDQTQTTTIISIVTIFVVACIISPIISKTEERKFNALAFFLKIPRHHIDSYIQKCSSMSLQENQENKEDKQRERMNSHIRDRIQTINDGEIDNNNIYGEISMNEIYEKSSQLNNINHQLISNHTNESHQYFTTSNQIHRESKNTIHTLNVIQSYNPNVQMDFDELEHNPTKELKTKDINKDRKQIYLEKPQGHHKNVRIASDVGSSENDSHFNSHVQVHQNLHDKKNNEIEEKHKLEEKEQAVFILEKNIKKINQIAFKRKSLTLLVVMSVMFVFSIYFVISFLMAKDSYEAAAESSKDLATIFAKEQCFDSLINFQRENLIRSQVLTNWENPSIVSSVDQLEICRNQEQSYINLRKNLPPYFLEAKTVIDKIEDQKFCDEIYVGEYAHMNNLCKTAINGLLNKGLSNSLFYMLNVAQKLQIQFDSAVQTKTNTFKFYFDQLYNPDVTELLDTKLYILTQAFQILKDGCMQSTFNYFEKLKGQFVIVFAIFITLLIFALIYFVFFAFQRLRKIMWSTNMLLKIIPHAALKKSDAEKLKQFFVN